MVFFFISRFFLYFYVFLLVSFIASFFNKLLKNDFLILLIFVIYRKYYITSLFYNYNQGSSRSGSRTAATSKMERFVIIVNGWKPLTIITKSSILEVAAVLDLPLRSVLNLLATIWHDIAFLYFFCITEIFIFPSIYIKATFCLLLYDCDGNIIL